MRRFIVELIKPGFIVWLAFRPKPKSISYFNRYFNGGKP